MFFFFNNTYKLLKLFENIDCPGNYFKKNHKKRAYLTVVNRFNF